ncbi:MAG TPA: hypothetical protein VL400_23565 [Polyangiaceae bacterium]|nr:hypothetical protein [Polyangiaceae bacterium]
MRQLTWIAAFVGALGVGDAPARAAEGVGSPSGKCGKSSDAEPTARARESNEKALAASKAGDYAEALRLFQEAYDDSPSFVILYNIGKMAALTGDHARAKHAFECHLELGDAAISPERRAEVEREIATSTAQVATLAIEVDVPDVAIAIDGVTIGKTPLDDLVFVNPGKRTVRATLDETEEQTLEVAKGTRTIVRFRFGKSSNGGPPTASEAPFRFPNGAVGAAWVTTGLATIAALVTGPFALVTASDISDDPYLGPAIVPPEGSELSDKIARARTLAIATDVLIGVAAVSGAAAITFSVVNAVGKTPDDGAAPRADLVIRPTWIGVEGRF